MRKALHPKYHVIRLYVSRNEEGKGLVSIEDSVDVSIKRWEYFTEKHEGVITSIRINTDNTKTGKTTITRKQYWKEKI